MEFKYPMWFKSKVDEVVVRFDNLDSGHVVAKCSNGSYDVGVWSDYWIDHTDTDVWEDVTDQYKGKYLE